MQFTLIIGDLREPRAAEVAALLEDQDEPPLAVTINETDEAARLWNVVAYFAGEAEARAAGDALKPLLLAETFTIDALPDVDWVRRSLEGLAPVVAGRFFFMARMTASAGAVAAYRSRSTPARLSAPAIMERRRAASWRSIAC